MSIRIKKHLLKIILYACLAVMFVSVFAPMKVFAEVDYGFYSANDIMFYDPSSCESGTTSTGSSNGIVVAIGDSVLAGASNVVSSKLMAESYTDVTIDAVVSRSLVSPGVGDTNGLQAVDTNATKIKSAGTIMVNLGTNFDGNFKSNLIKMISKIRALNSSARVFWTNVGTTSPAAANAMKETNGIIDGQKTSQNYTVIDWGSAVKAKPSLVPTIASGGDGIHPGAAGQAALADLIATSLGKVDTGGTGSGGGGGNTVLTGSSNPQKAYNYFVSKGLTPIQAVGIMGNIKSETASTWRPDIEQGMTYSDVMKLDGLTGYGLSQWTYLNRQQGLHDLAQKNGVKDSDFVTQLDYIWQELNGGYSRALSELRKASTVRDATDAILNQYELPEERVQNLITRTKYAQEYLAQFGNGVVDNTGCDPSTGSGNTAGQYGWDMTGPHAITYYSQCDPKWGSEPYGKGKSSICEGGCGLTSISIAIATLTGDSKITPAVLALRYGDVYHTVGTRWDLLPKAADDYGLKSKDLGTDLNKVAPILKSGGIVIATFAPGAFTSQGHFMVIRAINADGSKFFIADPYKGIHDGPYDADYLHSPGNLGNLWGYYK